MTGDWLITIVVEQNVLPLPTCWISCNTDESKTNEIISYKGGHTILVLHMYSMAKMQITAERISKHNINVICMY